MKSTSALELSSPQPRIVPSTRRETTDGGGGDCLGDVFDTVVDGIDDPCPSSSSTIRAFSEPSQNANFRDQQFPAGQDPYAVGVDPDHPISFDLTQDQPDNVIEANGSEVRLGSFEANGDGGAIVRLYGDLKRHDMGRRLAENIDEAGTGRSVWITKELWGVASTAPYMHDGRSTTLTETILEHGGEARDSRRAFTRLSEQEQSDLLAFLDNLVLLKLAEE